MLYGLMCFMTLMLEKTELIDTLVQYTPKGIPNNIVNHTPYFTSAFVQPIRRENKGVYSNYLQVLKEAHTHTYTLPNPSPA